MCFTNCETVELFVNGKSFGVKGYAFPRLGMETRYGYYPPEAMLPRTTGDLHLSWDVPYEPGTLRAVGMRNGQVAATTEIWTTGAAAAVKASPDRSQIVADRRDVAHIVVEIVDDSGRTMPTADNDVTFALEGPAKLIGVDNGNPVSHENYKGTSRQAFNGRCLAIVQSTRDAGQVRVTANSPSLKPGSCAVEVVKT